MKLLYIVKNIYINMYVTSNYTNHNGYLVDYIEKQKAKVVSQHAFS